MKDKKNNKQPNTELILCCACGQRTVYAICTSIFKLLEYFVKLKIKLKEKNQIQLFEFLQLIVMDFGYTKKQTFPGAAVIERTQSHPSQCQSM